MQHVLNNSLGDALNVAHRALHDDLRKLEEAARHTFAREDVLECLHATRIHVTDHFRFEEENGYMDIVLKREPRLKRAIDGLLAEHAMLAGDLDRLIQETERSKLVDESTRRSILAWIDDVRSHEIRENDVVQDAFDLDLGAED